MDNVNIVLIICIEAPRIEMTAVPELDADARGMVPSSLTNFLTFMTPCLWSSLMADVFL